MKNHCYLLTVTVLLLVVSLCACGKTPSESQDSVSSVKTTQSAQTKITLYADFSAGSADAEKLNLIKSQEQMISDSLTAEVLAQQLSEWTGIDFKINSAEVSGDSAIVDWAASSTLLAGLDDREQKKEFHFYDVDSLNWFMMDSLARTIKESLNISTIYYSMDGGKPIALENMTGFAELPVDQPYKGSVFYFAHVDNMGEDEALQFTYSDEENHLLLFYPAEFSAEGVIDENGSISFASQQGDLILKYYVIPNVYKENTTEFIDHLSNAESEELEKNVVVAKSESMNQETGEVTPYVSYSLINKDWIATAAVLCDSSEEASEWYNSFKAGAVRIESSANINAGAGISEEDAMDLLSTMLVDRITEETAIVAYGESDLDGQHCWIFSFGKNTAEKFTAEEHYAVTDDGEIYVMDIINNQYEPFVAG